MFRNKFIFHGHLNLLAWRNGFSSSFTFDANQFVWHASHSSQTFIIYILAVTTKCSRRWEPMKQQTDADGQSRRCKSLWNRIYSTFELPFANWEFFSDRGKHSFEEEKFRHICFDSFISLAQTLSLRVFIVGNLSFKWNAHFIWTKWPGDRNLSGFSIIIYYH